MVSKKVKVELVRLSEQRPQEDDCGLFGEVLSACELKEGTEVGFRDLSPSDIRDILEANQASKWYWVKGIAKPLKELFAENQE
jgi:hypothetical protein